jgi:hypothetical protein
MGMRISTFLCLMTLAVAGSPMATSEPITKVAYSKAAAPTMSLLPKKGQRVAQRSNCGIGLRCEAGEHCCEPTPTDVLIGKPPNWCCPNNKSCDRATLGCK